MKTPPAPRNKFTLNRPYAKASRSIIRHACGLNSAWLTEGEKKMRKAAFASLALLLSGFAAYAAPDTPQPVDQAPRTMDEALDRVITNENRLYGSIKNYSPL